MEIVEEIKVSSTFDTSIKVKCLDSRAPVTRSIDWIQPARKIQPIAQILFNPKSNPSKMIYRKIMATSKTNLLWGLQCFLSNFKNCMTIFWWCVLNSDSRQEKQATETRFKLWETYSTTHRCWQFSCTTRSAICTNKSRNWNWLNLNSNQMAISLRETRWRTRFSWRIICWNSKSRI